MTLPCNLCCVAHGVLDFLVLTSLTRSVRGTWFSLMRLTFGVLNVDTRHHDVDYIDDVDVDVDDDDDDYDDDDHHHHQHYPKNILTMEFKLLVCTGFAEVLVGEKDHRNALPRGSRRRWRNWMLEEIVKRPQETEPNPTEVELQQWHFDNNLSKDFFWFFFECP